MLRLIVLVLGIVIESLCFADAVPADQACYLDAGTIRVDYMEERRDHNNEVTHRRPMTLYRYQNQVAIEYPTQGITEKWERAKNKRIKLTRYFNDAQRGIEYQPGELLNNDADGAKKSAANNDWSMHWQLISNNLIASMTEEEHEGTKDNSKGCEGITFYKHQNKSSQSTLIWLAKLQLVESYSLALPTYTLTLKRQRTSDVYVAAYFAKLSQYSTIDYADIGDSESVPFLLKMINLGFVEHGASGFYDAQGHDIGARHNHAH